MYKIKRHKILNLFYLHDQYSGPITSEYEVMEEVQSWSIAHTKLKFYQDNTIANIDGLFEDFYRYEHMKGLWGVLNGVVPTIGQLFFVCIKEGHGKRRTLFELCQVKTVNEPFVTIYNHSQSKTENMTVAGFQGLALIPERDETFIQNWEDKTKIRYPRNFISQLAGVVDYRQVRKRSIALSQYMNDWDLPKHSFAFSANQVGVANNDL